MESRLENNAADIAIICAGIGVDASTPGLIGASAGGL